MAYDRDDYYSLAEVLNIPRKEWVVLDGERPDGGPYLALPKDGVWRRAGRWPIFRRWCKAQNKPPKGWVSIQWCDEHDHQFLLSLRRHSRR